MPKRKEIYKEGRARRQNQLMDQIALIGFYALCHMTFGWWHENTEIGGRFVKYLREWRTDDFLHLILCAGSVWLIMVCSILGLGLGLRLLGL